MAVSRKKTILTLGIALLVFLLVGALALLLSGEGGSSRIEAGEHPLRISEIMSGNSICPNADGVFCDWIEQLPYSEIITGGDLCV